MLVVVASPSSSESFRCALAAAEARSETRARLRLDLDVGEGVVDARVTGCRVSGVGGREVRGEVCVTSSSRENVCDKGCEDATDFPLPDVVARFASPRSSAGEE